MGERVARGLRFAAVAEDDVLERDGPAVVPVGGGAGDAPERRRQKMRPRRPVVVSFVEIRSEIVPLKVGENVPHEEAVALWPLQCREPATVVRLNEQRRGGSKQTIERIAPGGV